jgi:hypothetical protein
MEDVDPEDAQNWVTAGFEKYSSSPNQVLAKTAEVRTGCVTFDRPPDDSLYSRSCSDLLK